MMARHRLLVVDDEPGLAELLCEFAEDADFETMATTDAAAFLAALPTFAPTVVAIDVVMPTMDGIELIRHIARTNPDVAIIVMTGFNPHYADFAKRLGEASGDLTITTLLKPFDRKSFVAALADLTGPGPT